MNKYFKAASMILLLVLVLAACAPQTAGSDAMDDSGKSAEIMQEDSDSMSAESSMGEDKDADTMDDGYSDEAMDGDSMEGSDMDGDAMGEDKDSGSMDSMAGDGAMDGNNDGDAMEQKDGDGAMAGDDGAMMDKAELVLDFAGLPALGDGWAYEGWLIVAGTPHSSGVLPVNDDGDLGETSFMVEADTLQQAETFVLTIEPVPDGDPAPSPVHILAGDFAGENARLTAGHAAALGNDFMAAGGSFILGIPTSDNAADAYTSGIWFTGLELPQLPDGWIYEGWVVGPDGPISTGTFTNPSGGDSDAGGPTAGPNSAPALPGQDFLDPPIDLASGYTAVISIEPQPDNSPEPFEFKPLVKEIADAGDHVDQEWENNAGGFPSGSATR